MKVNGYSRHQKAKNVRVSSYTRKASVKNHRRHKPHSRKTVGVGHYTRQKSVKAHIRPQHSKVVRVRSYSRKK